MEGQTEDERLAAFLDGTMNQEERREMVKRFNQDAEARETLAVAADVLREMEEEDAAAQPPGDGG